MLAKDQAIYLAQIKKVKEMIKNIPETQKITIDFQNALFQRGAQLSLLRNSFKVCKKLAFLNIINSDYENRYKTSNSLAKEIKDLSSLQHLQVDFYRADPISDIISENNLLKTVSELQSIRDIRSNSATLLFSIEFSDYKDLILTQLRTLKLIFIQEEYFFP